ncbi:MAG TPA: ISL3 family transposase [Pyrinomonadaceae bacterium]|nr:ISL3 family transposase [Pyrinomonadaceae bacterium]
MSSQQMLETQSPLCDNLFPELIDIPELDDGALFDYAGLPGLRTISQPETYNHSITIRTKQTNHFEQCPKCGCPYGKDFKKNGSRPQYIVDEPRGLRSVRIEISRQSYLCKICCSAPQLPLFCTEENRRMTPRLLHYIQINSLLDPFSLVAQRTSLSPSTVKSVFSNYTRALDRKIRFRTPRVLGLDGVYINGKECAILTDIEAGLVIDVWKDYKTDQLINALRSIPGHDKIEVVVIDMSHKLRKAIQKALPQALVVIDKFHIQRYANRGIDEVRKRLRMCKRAYARMCTRDLLRKHWDKLEKEEKDFLETYFKLQPELRLAYETKEALMKIWHSSSSMTAKIRYQRWLEQFPLSLEKDFKELLTAMKNWGEYIFNFFDRRYTNAFTEQSNRQIKDLNREARGYSFETARAKIIYGTLLRKQLEAGREQMAEIKRQRKIARKLTGRRRAKSIQESGPTSPSNLPAIVNHQLFVQDSLFEN